MHVHHLCEPAVWQLNWDVFLEYFRRRTPTTCGVRIRTIKPTAPAPIRHCDSGLVPGGGADTELGLRTESLIPRHAQPEKNSDYQNVALPQFQACLHIPAAGLG